MLRLWQLFVPLEPPLGQLLMKLGILVLQGVGFKSKADEDGRARELHHNGNNGEDRVTKK